MYQILEEPTFRIYIARTYGRSMAIEEIAMALGAIVGIAIVFPIVLQFVGNVSRNMAQSNVAASEEQAKTARAK